MVLRVALTFDNTVYSNIRAVVQTVLGRTVTDSRDVFDALGSRV